MVQFHRLLAALSVCGAAVTVTTTNAQGSPSFDDIIATDGNLTALNAALMAANISLTAAFDDAVTLFAPIDSALTGYSELLATYADVQYYAHLENLLLMHVVESAVMSTDLMDGQVVLAANDENITVTIENSTGAVTISTADSNATVVAVDIASSDGVVHQIGGVLVPSFVSTGLLDLTKSVEGFSIVLELLEFTGLANLVSDDLTATVFAPTDEAFMKLEEGALEYYRTTLAAATTLLSGHVISPLIVPTQNMVNGELDTKTPAGTSLTIELVEMDGTTTYKVNNATIVMENVLANNGIIHALDTVLAVPGAEYPPLPMAPTGTSPTAPSATPPTASDSAISSTTTVMMATMMAFIGSVWMA
jgi:uncharacterized surface protein with fasciclin (FAS1) repeats